MLRNPIRISCSRQREDISLINTSEAFFNSEAGTEKYPLLRDKSVMFREIGTMFNRSKMSVLSTRYMPPYVFANTVLLSASAMLSGMSQPIDS